MARKMNILVCSPYYPPHIGGLENHAEEFAIQTVQRGHSVTVWTANIPKGGSYDEIKNGVRVVRYDALELLGGFPIPKIWKKRFWNQFKTIKKQTYTIIISRTRFFLSSVLALLFARRHGVAHVHIEHGSDYVHLHNPVATMFAYIYDNIVGAYILKKSDVVVANSLATKKFIKKLTRGSVNSVVIYRGVNIKDIVSQAPEATHENRAEGKVILCYVGRLIDGKGVHHLIDAIGSHAIREKIECWIIGDGKQRKVLEALASRLGIAESIVFFGNQNRKNAIALMKSSDIVINPSYTEGLPTSIIEAALCHKAIIATNVGGTSEIIEHDISGLLIPSHDTNALSTSIQKLIEHPEIRERLSDAAYKKCSTMFSWDAAINSYESLYKKIVQL